jgi:hypothetical protein
MGKPSKLVEDLLGPPGNPKPGVPMSEAVARKLGLDSPMGKTAYYGMYKTTYPVTDTTGPTYDSLKEEMVSRLAEK